MQSPESKQQSCNFIVKGKYWIGYQTKNEKFPGGYEIQGDGFSFGVEESLIGTNNIYEWMCIRTVSFGMIFTLPAAQIREMLDELSVNENPYDNPVEHYQIAKEAALFNRNKYKCSICDTFDHLLLNCPKCHLIVTDDDLFSKLKATVTRKLYMRKKTVSKKIRSKSRVI